MKRKPISAIAYVFLFFFIMIQLIPGVSAKERSVEVVCEDMTVGRVSLESSEKKVLSLQTEGLVAESFQWQILINEEQSQWVNIYDKTEANCEVSLAMIKNILNGADGAYIRGTVQTEGISVYSDPVYVFMETETTDRFIQQPESMEDLIVEAGTSAASSFRLMKTKASARDVKDFVTITIKYLDEASLVPGASELPIYTAYTAKLE